MLLNKATKGSKFSLFCRYRCVFTFLLTLTLICVPLVVNLKYPNKLLTLQLVTDLLYERNASDVIPVGLQNISQHNFSGDMKYEDQPGIPDDPRFQPINNHDAFVFSAFYDMFESQELIRLFGIQIMNLHHPVYCHIFVNDSAIIIKGTRVNYNGDNNNRFSPMCYVCPIDPNKRPDSVSLTFNETDTPTNNVKILYKSPLSRNFTVCYAALFNFSNHMQIIQNVEFNKILGAQHFFVYNFSISDNVNRVLRYYQKQGLMTVIQWQVPITSIHYYGQVLAINDCVYRNKGVSKYVAIQDTDEFIIPYQHSNWFDLIEKINAEYDTMNSKKGLSHKNVSTYIVESTFFQDEPNSSEWMTIKKNYSISEEDYNFIRNYSLTSMTSLKRLKFTFGNERTKYFVRPEIALFPSVHLSVGYRPQTTYVRVNQSLALVHHYRLWNKKDFVILEILALRFKASLLRLVKNTVSALLI